MAVAGVGTNRAFLADLLRLPEFADGRHDTATLARHWPGGWQPPAPQPHHLAEAVLARHLSGLPREVANPWQTLGAWRLLEAAGRPGHAVYYLDGAPVTLAGRNGAYCVRLPDGTEVAFSDARLADGWLEFERDGLGHRRAAEVNGARVTLLDGAAQHVITVATGTETLSRRHEGGHGTDEHVRAPMPGMVVEILTRPGEPVAEGDPVVVIEAMKLMQTLTAPRAGVIETIACAPGDTVEAGVLLVAIAPADQNNETEQGQPT